MADYKLKTNSDDYEIQFITKGWGYSMTMDQFQTMIPDLIGLRNNIELSSATKLEKHIVVDKINSILENTERTKHDTHNTIERQW